MMMMMMAMRVLEGWKEYNETNSQRQARRPCVWHQKENLELSKLVPTELTEATEKVAVYSTSFFVVKPWN